MQAHDLGFNDELDVSAATRLLPLIANAIVGIAGTHGVQL
jgi:hypothetical protein